jgi:hypothetical protein
VIPKSQDNKTLVAQPSVSLIVIIPLSSVLTSVYFDNQSPLETYKINNERAQRLLSAKFKTINLPKTQLSPKQTFGLCWMLPQLPCAHPGLAHNPLSLPFPARGKGFGHAQFKVGLSL